MNDSVRQWLLDPTIGKLVATAIGLLIVYAVVRSLQRGIGRYVSDNDTRYRARKFVTFIGYLVAILLLTVIYSDKLGGFTVAFGVAGAGIAFALQEVIASVAGWVALSFGNFYHPGDRVQLGGIKGDVIDIGILRTTLMEVGQWVNGDLYNGRIVRIANSYVFKEPVFNYSADYPFLWDEITLPVRYGSDWQYTRSTIEQVVNEVVGEYASQSKDAWNRMLKTFRLEEARIEPMVTLVANDNWIEFTARYIVDYRRRRWAKDRLYTRLLEEVDKSNDYIRLASATFEVVGLPPVDVRVSGSKVPTPSLS
ncbi:MAG: mechanosensitive ion channel domain-containing protein [Acidobacteriota bacterium]